MECKDVAKQRASESKALHVLITRFNLSAGSFAHDKNRNQTLTEEWYEERFDLFERICQPSVLNQKGKEFCWLLFFDTATPAEHLARISGYQQDSPNVRVVFCDGMQGFMSALASELDKLLADSPEMQTLVTSRLDNDDALNHDFTLAVREWIKKKPGETFLLDFCNGYALQTSAKALLRAKHDPFNPFLTLVESALDHVTIYRNKHADWRSLCVPAVRDTRRMWLQMIHQRNVANSMKRDGFLVPQSRLTGFGIEPGREVDFKLWLSDSLIVIAFYPIFLLRRMKVAAKCTLNRIRASTKSI